MHPTFVEYMVKVERFQVEQRARNYWKRNGVKELQTVSVARPGLIDRLFWLKLNRRGKA